MAKGRIIGAIPARYASTRLPGKPLRLIAGRPMIEHVVRRVEAVPELDRVVVLTDDSRIFDAVSAFGGEVEMTPEDCLSGTDRIAWAAKSWDCEAVINIQGDEPLIDASAVGLLARRFQSAGGTETAPPAPEMATLSAPLDPERFQDPNAVKVVTALGGKALYFSRSPIPYPRQAQADAAPRLHIGIYGYRRDVLLRLASLPPTPLELSESLEQLRALEHGIGIEVIALDRPAHPGVDTPEDLARVESLLQAQDSTRPSKELETQNPEPSLSTSAADPESSGS